MKQMLAALTSDAEKRSTGLPALGDVPWGSHFCQFYRGADDLREVLVPFFQVGLEQNERCLWITCDPLPAAAARAAMLDAVPRFAELEARGQIQIVDHDAWYLTHGALSPDEVIASWLEYEAEALRAGYAGLRVSGNTNWLAREQWREFKEYEACVHKAFHERRIVALCSYSLERCGSAELLDVLRNHASALVREGDSWNLIRSATALLAEVGQRVSEPPLAGRASVRPHLELVSPPCALDQGQGQEAGHEVRFYDEGRFPADAVAAFLLESLRARGAAIAVATEVHLGAIGDRLAKAGVDLAASMASGQLRLLHAEQALSALEQDGRVSEARFDAAIGKLVRESCARHLRVRVFGEIVDLLSRAGRSAEALELEGFWSALRERESFELLCAYGLSSFADARSLDAFAEVCMRHGAVHSPAEYGAEGNRVDASRLLVHFEQRTRALQSEVERGHRLEAERRELVSAERAAWMHAEAARRHLARLQRVTAALSEAVTVPDVRRVLHGEMLEAVEAVRSTLAVPDPKTGKLRLVGDGYDAPEDCVLAYETSSVVWLGGERAGECHGSSMRAFPDEGGRVKTVAMPLVLGARRLGAVSFEFSAHRELHAADQALLDDLARQLAFALDRAMLYEMAMQARERAEEANRTKDEFLAMLGHELRNPLSPMLTALQLMRLRAGDVAVRERTVIERQVQHMVRLVDDLLDVARITRGTLELARQPMELWEVVSRAIEIASPVLEQRAHRLNTSVPQTGLVIEADPHRLAQVVANLLTNAAKYTPEGGRIEVSAHASGERVHLAVSDNGVGIEPSLLPHVFDMFVQGRQTLDRARGGLGLGLSIVRRLVELHGGSVRADSPGRDLGSTFSLELPRVRLPAGAEPQASAPDLVEPEGASEPLRVLIVDDNVDAAEMLAAALSAGGHDIKVAHDGPDALALVESFEPALALLDIGLPVMDGFELAQQLRARFGLSPLKLIAITGYGQPADVAKAKAAGFDEHFVKPMDLGRLYAIVDELRSERSGAH